MLAVTVARVTTGKFRIKIQSNWSQSSPNKCELGANPAFVNRKDWASNKGMFTKISTQSIFAASNLFHS